MLSDGDEATEHTRLRGLKTYEQPGSPDVELVKPSGSAGPFGTFFNLANCAIGAGILGLPFAFDTMGIVLCIIFWILVAAASSYTLHLLVKIADENKLQSYEEVVEQAFGVWILRLVQVIIFIYAFGVVVGYMIIVGDLVPPVLAEWTNTPINDGAWYLKPEALSGLATAVIILPLALLKRLDALKWTSFFAILAMTYFLMLVIVLAAIDFTNRNGSPPYQGEPRYFYWSLNMFQGIPILFFASGGHLQAIGLYKELAPQYQNQPTWDSIVVLVEGGVLSFFYLIVGGVSYCRWYPVDNGNILKLMIQNDNSVSLQVASLAVVFVVILSAPLVLFPMRFTIDKLIFRNFPNLYTDKHWLTYVRYFGWTILLVGLTYTINAVVGDLKLVFGLTGAIGATTIKVIVPSAVYLKLGNSRKGEMYESIDYHDDTAVNKTMDRPVAGIYLWEKILCWSLIVWGVVMGSISTYVVIAKAIGQIGS